MVDDIKYLDMLRYLKWILKTWYTYVASVAFLSIVCFMFQIACAKTYLSGFEEAASQSQPKKMLKVW